MRVLLVYPNAKKEIIAFGDLGAIAEPIALEYIGAGARLDGHDVTLLDLRLHNADLEPTLEALQPDVVAVTGYSMHVLRNLKVCRIAKQLVPDCKTVVGGHHATLEAVDFQEPEMDYIVIGEGVAPFREILGRLEEGSAVADVPGVWSRVEGEWVFGGKQPPFDINDIPRPDRTLVEADRGDYYIDWMKPIALIRTTVGCPFRCSFCALWRIMDGRYYKRELEPIIEELRSIPERYVFLVDDEPFIDAPRMRALAQAIGEADLDKEFFSYCRVDSLLRDRDLIAAWHKIGLRRLLIGVETIFDHELAEYNKRQEKEQIIEALEAAKEIGVSVFCNFIIKPTYTEREFEQVMRFIQDNNVDYPSFTILTPIPGTEADYDTILDRQPNGRPNWDYFDLQHAVTQTTLTKAEFEKQFDNLYQVFTTKYLDNDSPLIVQAFDEEPDENLRKAYVALASGVLNKRHSSIFHKSDDGTRQPFSWPTGEA